MSLPLFYREQAALQQSAADAAMLDNVRDRCLRAKEAWAALAMRSERAEKARLQAAIGKSPQHADIQPLTAASAMSAPDNTL